MTIQNAQCDPLDAPRRRLRGAFFTALAIVGISYAVLRRLMPQRHSW